MLVTICVFHSYQTIYDKLLEVRYLPNSDGANVTESETNIWNSEFKPRYGTQVPEKVVAIYSFATTFSKSICWR